MPGPDARSGQAPQALWCIGLVVMGQAIDEEPHPLIARGRRPLLRNAPQKGDWPLPGRATRGVPCRALSIHQPGFPACWLASNALLADGVALFKTPIHFVISSD
ncbi:MAG: hypothetical protein ACRC0C_07400, partial [Gibbsiella quercinecans]|uniref:hypothetical protein n=1 Tax=Gibbsiella quercinecans TaxID=929813 RepID=UPI003F2CDAD2